MVLGPGGRSHRPPGHESQHRADVYPGRTLPGPIAAAQHLRLHPAVSHPGAADPGCAPDQRAGPLALQSPGPPPRSPLRLPELDEAIVEAVTRGLLESRRLDMAYRSREKSE